VDESGGSGQPRPGTEEPASHHATPTTRPANPAPQEHSDPPQAPGDETPRKDADPPRRTATDGSPSSVLVSMPTDLTARH
jgi:hypothetical protein